VPNHGQLIAIDQGTSSTKGLLLDSNLRVLATVTKPVELEFPESGWVQQDPTAIWDSVRLAIDELSAKATEEILGLAITNQRESALAWDVSSGRPLSPMLGWQDRRTAGRVHDFSAQQSAQIREISGLPLDPMFSALKFEWILDQIDADRTRSAAGEIALGTLDTWLVYKLTGQLVAEAGNASRTQLLNVTTGEWSAELSELFNIPLAALAPVVGSDQPTQPILSGPLAGKPVLAVLADSHAALYAHQLGSGATAKATFGTGSSIMAHSPKPAAADSGLVTTVAWSIDGKLTPALEGNILASGATVVWLSQLLQKSPSELDRLAQTVAAGSSQVNLVPAFGGLGAPWWDADADAIIDGMTLATGQAELALAAFEAINLQIEDVLATVDVATGSKLGVINVDGGPTSNNWLMQQQANLSQRTVIKNNIAELSATGVAALAFKVAGIDLASYQADTTSFEPNLETSSAEARQTSWHAALAKSRMQRSN
jgi:glycerol kinase